MSLIKIVSSLSIVLLLHSCGIWGVEGRNKKIQRTYYEKVNYDQKTIDEVHPKFDKNGGYKTIRFYNRKAFVQERNRMNIVEQKNLLKTQLTLLEEELNKEETSNNESFENNPIDVKLYIKKLKDLKAKIDEINQFDINAFEEIKKLTIQLNELKCQEIEGIRLINKKIKRLYGDINFKTGSYKISGSGMIEISSIVSDIITQVNEWKNYLNECDVKVFENDLFEVAIEISGYADQRGSEKTNLILSERRANTVKEELEKELFKLVDLNGINLVYDRMYSEGHGEKLPPGVKQAGIDDPNRRLCIINYIVAPSRYLAQD